MKMENNTTTKPLNQNRMKTKKQLTAVEWLVEQLPLIQQEGLRYVIEQAKQMEKEQIIDAYYQGDADSDNIHVDAEQYYNETFKSE